MTNMDEQPSSDFEAVEALAAWWRERMPAAAAAKSARGFRPSAAAMAATLVTPAVAAGLGYLLWSGRFDFAAVTAAFGVAMLGLLAGSAAAMCLVLLKALSCGLGQCIREVPETRRRLDRLIGDAAAVPRGLEERARIQLEHCQDVGVVWPALDLLPIYEHISLSTTAVFGSIAPGGGLFGSICRALVRLLPRLTEGRIQLNDTEARLLAGRVAVAQSPAARRLGIVRDSGIATPTIALAALVPLESRPNRAALPLLKYAQSRCGNREVRSAIRRCVAAIEARAAAEARNQTLPHPASAPSGADALVRPAIGTPDEDAALLLRPTRRDETDA